MKHINIQINKAILETYSVNVEKTSDIKVSATLGLYAGKKKITEVTFHTESWYGEETHFDLPFKLVEPIAKIAKELELIATRTCTAAMKELPAHKNKDKNEI